MLLQRTLFFFSINALLLLTACGSSDSSAPANTDATEPQSGTSTPEAKTVTDPSRNAVYQKGLSLVAKSDCLTCHKIDEAMTGPSYRAIAEKYAGAPNDAITALAQTIIKGGAGNWGNVPMTPHPSLSQDDAETMVRYILELNNR